MNHPAKFTDKLMPVFIEMLEGSSSVLDPFAGTGKIHLLPFNTVGVEIEKEWAEMSEFTIHGDSLKLSMIFTNNMFDAICTSPTYGNRMADCHNAKDNSKRNTYTHYIGRQLTKNNSGKMQWGNEYKNLHSVVYRQCFEVLKSSGLFVLNIKNHIRKGVEIDVFGWHVKELINLGFILREVRQIPVNGNGYGANNKNKIKFEYIAKFEKEVLK